MHAFPRTAMMAILVVGLGGCASIGAATPPDTYEIAPPKVVKMAGATRAQLLIPEPTAIKTLDSNQIVVKPTPYTVEYLAQSQWSDRLPHMLQLRFVQAFENTGRVAAVGVPGQGLAIDYQVVMEIRKFEIDASGGNAAVVEIAVKALNDRNGTVRATRVFSETIPVTGAGNPGYVAALNVAFDRVTADIVKWTLGLV
ncbi:ABC-type transport auxiliary lipoprotein family protein [Aureimonas glaciei]|jgi:cholesterol transport system auxiliary component|uniref:ABC transporter n=1 Tax=Aureimonas glaciei TaxID=1776957 RepID=A0A917DAQ4_9HYPH|nr:ABC-type transport auxiliary lipoprotein family protein [Aureimonas glaciei]GGD18074.1 ABC transporter [Aureimonas glaciei]